MKIEIKYKTVSESSEEVSFKEMDEDTKYVMVPSSQATITGPIAFRKELIRGQYYLVCEPHYAIAYIMPDQIENTKFVPVDLITRELKVEN